MNISVVCYVKRMRQPFFTKICETELVLTTDEFCIILLSINPIKELIKTSIKKTPDLTGQGLRKHC